jgi:hypothetical protein
VFQKYVTLSEKEVAFPVVKRAVKNFRESMSNIAGENDTMNRGIFKVLERKTHRIL